MSAKHTVQIGTYLGNNSVSKSSTEYVRTVPDTYSMNAHHVNRRPCALLPASLVDISVSIAISDGRFICNNRPHNIRVPGMYIHTSRGSGHRLGGRAVRAGDGE